MRYSIFLINTPPGYAPRVGPAAFIEGKWAIQDNHNARVIAWATDESDAISIYRALNAQLLNQREPS